MSPMISLKAKLRRHLAIADFALGAMRRRLAASVSLGVGLGLVVMLYASGTFVTDALRAEIEVSLAHAPDLTLQRMVAGRPALIASDAAALLQDDPGVASVSPRVWGYLYVPAIEANVVVIADPELSSATEPGDPRPAIPASCGVALAERLGLRAGDRLSVPGSRGPVLLQIDEIRPSESALHDADVLLVPSATASELLGVPAGFSVDVAIQLTRPEEALAVGERLTRELAGVRVIDKRSMRRTYELTFDGRGGLLNALFLPCLAALLLLTWQRLTAVGGDERYEVGVLKTLGWQTGDVMLARLYESGLIAFFGSVGGLVGAYGYVFWLHAPGLSGVLFGWSVLHADLALAPSIDSGAVLSLLTIVVLPFFAVSLIPIWRIASVGADA